MAAAAYEDIAREDAAQSDLFLLRRDLREETRDVLLTAAAAAATVTASREWEII